MMEDHLSIATIAALSKILRTCRNLRHVIGREPTPGDSVCRQKRSASYSERRPD